MDLLNFVPNVHHMWRNFGGWTFAFGDYHSLNLTAKFDDPNMFKLTAIVDGYSYRSRLTMPKLIASTTGDEFFQIDDSRYYFHDLPGDNHLLMMHNAEHSCATALGELLPAIHAFALSVMENKPRPSLTWSIDNVTGALTMETMTRPEHVYLRHAHTLPSQSGTRKDFRLIRANIDCPSMFQVKGQCIQPVLWAGEKIAPTSTKGAKYTYTASLPAPEKGYVAFFLEAKFPGVDIVPFTFTTETSIVPLGFPFPPCYGEGCLGKLV